MTKQVKYYNERKAAGLCVRCPVPPSSALVGKTMCQSCLDKARLKAEAWNAQLRADMLKAYGEVCVRCGSSEMLDFHHIHEDGDEHRLATGNDPDHVRGSWHDLRKRGFPPVIETLCRKCHKSHHAS